MKKVFFFLLIGIVFTKSNCLAQTIVWTGTTSTDFFDPSNWVGGVGYTGGEDVLFNSGSNNCDITSDMAVTSFSVMSGYTGIIDFDAADHFIDNALVINSGTVIGSSSGLAMNAGTFLLGAGGTYSTNGGTFGVGLNPGESFTFSGNIILNTLGISTSVNGSQRNVDFGTNLIVDDLDVTSGSSTNRPIGYQGTIHIKNGLTVSGTSSTTISNNTASLIFDGTSAILSGATVAGRMPLPNITMSITGNYSMSNHLTVNGNWTGTQGTLTAGTSNVYFTGTSASISGTAAAFDNLNIQTGASLSFPASAEVQVCRNLVNSGTCVFGTASTLGLNGGTNSQVISGNAITVPVFHAHSGSRSVSPVTGITVTDFIQIDNNVTFASGGNLTLTSTTAQTARVGSFGSGASITGNVTVETAIPGGFTGWTLMGVRGVAGQQFSSWDTYVSSSGANGIPMTCVGCVYSPTVIGTGSASFTSIQSWNESTETYAELVNTTAITPGQGYWVYVGDGTTNTNNLKTINTGTLVQGTVNVPVTNNGNATANSGYNLVANPYPSAISFTNLFNFGGNSGVIDPTIYSWNPDKGSGAGGYTSFNTTTGSSDSPTIGITNAIAGGQAFYVFFPDLFFFGTDNLVFDESVKLNSNPLLLKGTESVNLKRFRLSLAGSNDWDETSFCIIDDATPIFDRKYDAYKIFQTAGYSGYPGSYNKYTTISSQDAESIDYSINTLPPLYNQRNIPILARVSNSGSYTITAKDFEDFATCVGLIDKTDNSYHDLRLSPYVFTISDTTSTPRFELVLCKDESLNTTGISNQSEVNSNIVISQNQDGAYVKTVFDKNTKAVISAYNIVGQKLMDDISVYGTYTNTTLPLHLHNQVVIIKVSSEQGVVTKKIVLH